MAEKPILFNTEMVRAILEGRKTQTRRVIKPHNPVRAKLDGYTQGYGLFFSETRDHTADNWYIKDYTVSPCWISDRNYIKLYAPYKTDDTLWVRETWNGCKFDGAIAGVKYWYKADCDDPDEKWRPSIHMPREAARIFLRVKGVRVERLRNMTDEDAYYEGIRTDVELRAFDRPEYGEAIGGKNEFSGLWDSTIKKADLQLYGWDANPFCWIISFERV